MKRCIICGNMDDDSSTVCSMCGNPYVDMGEGISGAEETSGKQPEPETAQAAASGVSEPETASEEPAGEAAQGATAGQPEVSQGTASEEPEGKTPQQQAGKEPEPLQTQESGRPGPGETPQADIRRSRGGNPGMQGQPASGNRPPRRMRSGPQIYGQAEGMNGGQEYYANQGMVRRTVPPRSGQTAGGRPGGQAAGEAGRPSGPRPGDPARRAARTQGGRPGNQVPGGAGRQPGSDFLSRRVMETARKSFRSPLFLLIVVLNTVFVVSSIAAIFLNELNYSQVIRLVNEADLPQQASGYVGTVTTLLQRLDSGHMILPNVLLHVPQILFCLGLWLVLITAFAARDRMPGVGFGFAKAAVIIRMVAACIVMFITLIIMVTVVIAAWASGQRPIMIMSAVMLVLTIIVVMMIVMYYFSWLATLRTCGLNSGTGESYGKLSAYVAVLHVILALPGIIGLLSGIVNMEITGIVGSVAKMGWMILFAVWIFRYRGKMSEFE